MFRRLLLACACLGVAVGVAVSAAPAWSQDRSTQERLERLERDLNMLQRQVYRGAPAPVMGGGGGGAVNTEIRMDRLESQMRDLTGHVEEFTNQIDQLRQRVEQVNSDVEVRLGQGSVAAANPAPLRSGSAGPARPGPASPARPARQFASDLPSADDEDLLSGRPAPGAVPGSPFRPGTAVPPPSGPVAGGPTPIFGTLTPPGAPASPGPLASAAPAGHPPAGGSLPSGSATEQYNYAFGLLKQADYPAAEVALKAFVEQHPKDPMAGNAQYWLGETYYTRKQYLEAASVFAEGYKRYPKSAKAADNLLKLGMALGRANRKDDGCVALGRLGHDFPNPGAAIKERAAAEKKQLGC
jgi:tol-pal system protein YbgF